VKRILWLQGGLFRPNDLSVEDKFRALSREFRGDILASVSREAYAARREIGAFRVHSAVRRGDPFPVRHLAEMRHAWQSSLRLREAGGRYDAVVSTDPLQTGWTALQISRRLGAPLIVEINGNFLNAFMEAETGMAGRLRVRGKRLLAKALIRRVLDPAAGVKLLYPTQLDGLPLARTRRRVVCFPDFVPIQRIRHDVPGEGYVLFLGYPWFLKGVDLLIRAFRRIEEEFPAHRLKIVGWCPEGKEPFVRLAGGSARIEFHDPVPYPDALRLIERASLVVLPSRTEAMGRVLIEAMAARKPVIASRVDGVPHYVRDGETGVLFERENVDQLSREIRRVLSDPAFSARVAEGGFRFVRDAFREDRFADHYARLVREAAAMAGERSGG